MKKRNLTKGIALSVTLIIALGGCGSTGTVKESSKIERVSPFVSQTLSPSEMPVFDDISESGLAVKGNVSMTVDKTTFEKNDIATITLKDMPGQYDWIGLFHKDDASKRENLLNYEWTGDFKRSGSVKIKIVNSLKRQAADISDGEYEIRAFTKSGKYIQLSKTAITVKNQNNNAFNPVISLKNTQNFSGKKIDVSLNGLAEFAGEWIGIFPKDSENVWENALEWEWTDDAKNGQISLQGVPAGQYDIRAFYDEDMELETSIPLTVLANQDTPTISSNTSFAANERILVNFAGMPGNNADWIGIFSTDSDNNPENSITLEWTNGLADGSISFDKLPEGTYEIRAFSDSNDDGEPSVGDQMLTTKRVTVIAADATRKVAIFADEHDPHNRLLAVDYENMELVEEIQVTGSLTHHADVVGDVDTATYVLMVPKKSTFINVYNVRTKEFVKKIDLPFQPRSADAFNASKNLVLLTAGNRPAAVLLDATTWEIVGTAGMKTTCDLKFNKFNYHPWYYKSIVFSYKDIPSSKLNCTAPDFGGGLISGHPRWLGNKHFAILDRANRLVEVYRLDRKDKNGQWKISLTDVVRTSTSLHQMIPSGKDDGIYYGMSEGNGNGDGVAPVMYKWKFVNGKLKELAKTPLVTEKTVTIMKDVGAYDLFSNFWNQYKSNQSYYQYYYPVLFPNKYAQYYPGNADNYYADYYNGAKNDILNYHNSYAQKVPVEVKKQFNSLGGHNLYISPAVNGTQYLWGAVASGQAFVVNTKTMKISNVVKANKGAGHVSFQQNGKYAIITNHKSDEVSIANYKTQKWVKDVHLPYTHEGIATLTQSHAPYVTLDDKYYHDAWTDGGVFFRINLDTLELDSKDLHTGGVPIQGNYYPNYKGE